MRVKKNPHGIALYMSLGEAKLLTNILVWSLKKLPFTASPISNRFLVKLNPKLEKHNILLNNAATPLEYLTNG